MLDAKLFKLGLVPFQSVHDICTVHRAPKPVYAALADGFGAAFAAFSRASLARISDSRN
jgi:hypothetical protein